MAEERYGMDVLFFNSHNSFGRRSVSQKNQVAADASVEDASAQDAYANESSKSLIERGERLLALEKYEEAAELLSYAVEKE
jgi:hypothetical protein